MFFLTEITTVTLTFLQRLSTSFTIHNPSDYLAFPELATSTIIISNYRCKIVQKAYASIPQVSCAASYAMSAKKIMVGVYGLEPQTLCL